MSTGRGEIIPQFTYSPEGELRIRTDLAADEHIAKLQADHLENLELRKGVQISEGRGDVDISIELAQTLGASFDAGDGEPELASFVTGIMGAINPTADSGTDRVAALRRIAPPDMRAVIYPHFQRWLQAKGFDETAALRGIAAMATPYGRAETYRARRDFAFLDGMGTAETLSVAARSGPVNVQKFEASKDNVIVKIAAPAWTRVELATVGGAVLGSAVDANAGITLHPNKGWLYELRSANITNARQSLSLLLGLGALAHRADQYGGREDIFASIEWTRTKLSRSNAAKYLTRLANASDRSAGSAPFQGN